MTLHLPIPLSPWQLPEEWLPPAASETLGMGVEMLVAALAFAVLFVLFGLQTRRDAGGCGGCSGDSCGSDSCPSTTAELFREETS